MGDFGRIFEDLAKGGGAGDERLIDATHLKAHRTAAGLRKTGLLRDLSSGPKAG